MARWVITAPASRFDERHVERRIAERPGTGSVRPAPRRLRIAASAGPAILRWGRDSAAEIPVEIPAAEARAVPVAALPAVSADAAVDLPAALVDAAAVLLVDLADAAARAVMAGGPAVVPTHRRPAAAAASVLRSSAIAAAAAAQACAAACISTLGNSALDARPYSLTGQTVEKPSYASSRFGFSLFGPLSDPQAGQGRLEDIPVPELQRHARAQSVQRHGDAAHACRAHRRLLAIVRARRAGADFRPHHVTCRSRAIEFPLLYS